MDKLKEFLKYTICSAEIDECFYGDNYTCAECTGKMLAEHDTKVRAETIDEFAELLKTTHLNIDEIVDKMKGKNNG